MYFNAYKLISSSFMVLAKQVSLVSVQLFGVGYFCLITSDVFLQHFFCFGIKEFPRLFLENAIMTA